ncbi:MAG TPA: phosphate ABC transporter permease subunit PstC [Phototrophicaceae bacterium]|nr:phosphate ABC transporter permease subunit PstC [Phototrophicaceae bacterium]
MEQAIETSYSSTRRELLSQAGERRTEQADIRKRPRPGEQIIFSLLLAAGILSILTTLFIVYFLGKEAITFFSSRAWVHSKMVVVNESQAGFNLRPNAEGAVSAGATLILIDLGGKPQLPFTPGSYLQIDDEIMRVTERREQSLVVERGQMATSAQAHQPGALVLGLMEDPIEPIEALAADATTIKLPPRASAEFQPGQVIHIDTETLLITAIAGDNLVVERGYEGTEARAHEVGAFIEEERRPDLITYFTHTVWQPQTGNFGVLPLIEATLMTTAIAILVALPVGLSAAIYLSEYASPRTRNLLNPVLEILVGVPTVVYGFFALQFVTQGLLQPAFGVAIYNTLSAGLVVGLMIVPTIASMSIDAMGAVPRGLREASYGLGATKLETVTKVVLPAALSGIVAAVILGISRAVGETMIVAIAAGNGPNWSFPPNFTIGAETMTGHINRISGGDLSYQSVDYTSIFSIGLTLFILTFALTQISTAITRRFRESYE